MGIRENIITLTDSYKQTHGAMLPPGTHENERSGQCAGMTASRRGTDSPRR